VHPTSEKHAHTEARQKPLKYSYTPGTSDSKHNAGKFSNSKSNTSRGTSYSGIKHAGHKYRHTFAGGMHFTHTQNFLVLQHTDH
jgi:hypothetical protein